MFFLGGRSRFLFFSFFVFRFKDNEKMRGCLCLIEVLAFLVELTLLLGGGILVLLVLGHKIVHVGLGLSELHLVHALTSVPVKERLATEHGSELLRDALEELLDGGGVTDEGHGHLETLGRDVANGGLDVVRDPLHKVGGVLVLDVEHLLVDLLGGHAAAEDGGSGEVATMARVGGSHHVLGIEHLLGELRDGEGAVLLGASGGERGEADEEEVQTRERNEVDRELAEISVELTREAEARGGSGHDGGHKVVKVTIGRGGELEGAEADVIERLIVNAHDLIGILDELMDRQGGVVGLNDSVGHLGRRHNGVGDHHAVRVLLTDLGDEQSAHTRASSTTERVGDLEALKAVARLSLLSDHIESRVNELSALSVVTLGPVVTSTALSEHKVVRAEDLTKRTRTDSVHGSRLKINQDRARHIASAGRLIVVNIDALELKIRVSVIGSSRVNTVLIRDNFPELGTNLVTALTSLKMDDFSHFDDKLSF
eukprot:comp22433_c1_seq1/m.54978 comp22433_c1_seq1/g.54978  ORF comp22433_c1_seq1/g.54978 comp22433_c1_seq1/m.54978 type:complete len:484 (+) comp22433_c1_seq1:197-1648(+)